MSDDIIWQVIGGGFCSYKLKAKTQSFCRNSYNLTGICSRGSCPLANSRYATVREVKGVLYLYIKTIERQHLPSRLWERIRLSRNYKRALEQIDERLQYWPEFNIHKCKQRLTRLTQYLMKTRKLALTPQARLEAVTPKVARREQTRERKALAAAKLEVSIEKELLRRLKTGQYGDAPLNVNEEIWQRVMKQREKTGDMEADNDDEEEEEFEPEFIEEEEEEEELEDIEDGMDMYNGESGSESEWSESDQSDSDAEQVPARKRQRGPAVEIEYEEEHEPLSLRA